MRIILQSCQIVGADKDRNFDVLVEDGLIKEIGQSIPPISNDVIVSSNHLSIAPGFLDLNTFCGEPGYEQREDFRSVSKAAASGGFTEICMMPDTFPALHSRPELEYVINRNKNNIVNILPVGALTLNTEGVHMAEMLDMHTAGAVAFSDGNKGIVRSAIVERAMQYAQQFNGIVLIQPEDVGLNEGKQMHEGKTAAMLGLEGMPAIAEELGVYRELQLLAYTNARVHLMNISTAGSVDLIRQAKLRGLSVTASVNAYNLFFTDEDLNDFDTNMKCNPPFRTKADISALLKGLEDGTIDAVTTGHTPWDPESKQVEFLYAKFGMIGLETAFSILTTVLGKEKIELIVRLLSFGPRKILNRSVPALKAGVPANLTMFDTSASFTYNEKSICSKSKNTPLINSNLKGRIVGIINNNQYFLNELN